MIFATLFSAHALELIDQGTSREVKTDKEDEIVAADDNDGEYKVRNGQFYIKDDYDY